MLNSKGNKESPGNGSLNTIGAGTTLIGDVNSNGDIRIDGTMKGNVVSSALVVIGNSAKLEGNIESSRAIVEGQVNGNITVKEELTLKSSAIVGGDIVMQKLLVENGAVFNGSSTMNKSSSHAQAK